MNRVPLRLKISFKKIKWLPTILSHAPPLLLMYLDEQLERNWGWAKGLAADIMLANKHVDTSCHQQFEHGLEGACRYARESPASWAAAVKLAAQAAGRFFIEQAKLEIWNKEAARIASEHDVPLFAAHQEAPASMNVFVCYSCGTHFDTKAKWKKHQTVAHGYIAPARYMAHGGDCLSCNTRFHTRPRLVWHLKRSHRCIQALIDNGVQPLTDDNRAALEEDERKQSLALRTGGRSRYHAELPSMKIAGPGLQPVTALVGSLEPQPPEATIASTPQQQDKCTVPIPMHDGVQFAVHFYCGPRRPQDFQDVLQAKIRALGLLVVVMSLDIVLHERCDLSSPANSSFWRNLGLAGRIAFSHGGPPCESWCTLRGCGPGPEAMRSLMLPWGIESLTGRAATQLEVANFLMRFYLWFVVVACCGRFVATLEHPWILDWCCTKASIWSTPQLEAIRALPNVDMRTVDLCMLGLRCPEDLLPIKKTTGLLVVNGANNDRHFDALPHKGRCCGTHRHGTLKGKKRNGGFRTAAAKLYVPQFSELLANLALDAIGITAQRQATGWEIDDEIERLDLTPFMSPIDVYDTTKWTAWGSDYGGRPNASGDMEAPDWLVQGALAPLDAPLAATAPELSIEERIENNRQQAIQRRRQRLYADMVAKQAERQEQADARRRKDDSDIWAGLGMASVPVFGSRACPECGSQQCWATGGCQPASSTNRARPAGGPPLHTLDQEHPHSPDDFDHPSPSALL